MKVYICGEGGCCPAVELQRDKVTIGEEGNQVTLKKNEWNELINKIKTDQLKAI